MIKQNWSIRPGEVALVRRSGHPHLVGKSMATANVRRWSREIGIF